jgi:hypothetical protein
LEEVKVVKEAKVVREEKEERLLPPKELHNRDHLVLVYNSLSAVSTDF